MWPEIKIFKIYGTNYIRKLFQHTSLKWLPYRVGFSYIFENLIIIITSGSLHYNSMSHHTQYLDNMSQ